MEFVEETIRSDEEYGQMIRREYKAKTNQPESTYFSYFIAILASLKNFEIEQAFIADNEFSDAGDIELYPFDFEHKEVAYEKYKRFKANPDNQLLGFMAEGKFEGKFLVLGLMPSLQKLIVATTFFNPANLSKFVWDAMVEEFGNGIETQKS